MAEVKPITYSLQFRGRATPLASNLVRLELTAPSAALVTTIGAMGIRTRFDDVLGGEAVLRSETSFDELSFDDRGTIEFGRGNTLHFRSIGSRLTPCPDPGLRHGIVIRRVEGGDGQFAGCEGLIASNFLISDTGEVTENHAGVIFVAPAPTTPCTDGVFARESPNEKRRSRLGAWRLTRAWRSSGTQPSSSEPVTPHSDQLELRRRRLVSKKLTASSRPIKAAVSTVPLYPSEDDEGHGRSPSSHDRTRFETQS